MCPEKSITERILKFLIKYFIFFSVFFLFFETYSNICTCVVQSDRIVVPTFSCSPFLNVIPPFDNFNREWFHYNLERSWLPAYSFVSSLIGLDLVLTV